MPLNCYTFLQNGEGFLTHPKDFRAWWAVGEHTDLGAGIDYNDASTQRLKEKKTKSQVAQISESKQGTWLFLLNLGR